MSSRDDREGMEGEPLENPAGGKVDMLVVQTRVVLVEFNKIGVYFRIRACRSCSWTRWWG